MEDDRPIRCYGCGRIFDLSEGGYYDHAIRGFLCPQCVQAIGGRLSYQDAVRVQMYGVSDKSPSIGGTIAKAATGLLFFATLGELDEVAEILIAIVLGLAMLAWAAWPWIRLNREKEAAKAALDRALRTMRAEAQSAAGRRLNTPRRCPYCGAPTKGYACEYCGSPLPR